MYFATTGKKTFDRLIKKKKKKIKTIVIVIQEAFSAFIGLL